MNPYIQIILAAALPVAACAKEFHVAADGNDNKDGTKRAPFRTIQHAADLAQPGDTVLVHGSIKGSVLWNIVAPGTLSEALRKWRREVLMMPTAMSGKDRFFPRHQSTGRLMIQ